MARPSWRGAALAVFVSLVVFFSLAVSSLVVSGRPARAADPESTTVAATAAAWLADHQVDDPGTTFHRSFEIAPSFTTPGFETPDAVLAIAEAAQTTSTWSTAEALAAVQALPLDVLSWLDDWIDGELPPAAPDPDHPETPGPDAAAKVMLLVTEPLGLSSADFDPDDDSADPVDLFAMVAPDGCAGGLNPVFFFFESLYGALAFHLECGTVPAAQLALVRAGQRSDGGWNFFADQDPGTASDVDVTGFALQVLIAGGVEWDDPDVAAGLAFLAARQQASGAWKAVGFPEPEDGPESAASTSFAVLAITGAGFDPRESCWRDSVAPQTRGSAYADPYAWLRGQLAGPGDDEPGHIISPFDEFGINSLTTSQTVQALRGGWFPIARAPGAPDCAPEPDPVPAFTG